MNLRDEIISKFQFLELVGRLKHLPRTGWLKMNVKDPETVAGHMYRMAMMTFLIDDPSVDRIRCMEMSLVHDLAESIIGDITPHCGVSREDKHKRECKAMDEIAQLMGKCGTLVKELFMEYEQQKTTEAKLVKQLDLFDMAFQAFEYEKMEKSPGRLQEFFDSTSGKFTYPLLAELSSYIDTIRNNS